MNRSTINVKTLDTTRSIFEAKRAKIQRAKSILARTRDTLVVLVLDTSQVTKSNLISKILILLVL